jgi:nicotinamide riboside transporter PnuC
VRRRRTREARPLPQRPYRDSLVLYLIMGAVIVVVSWATGGELARAFLIAILFVLVATAWSWWRFRQRLEREAQR